MSKPDFFIVGAPKCGTTSLSEYLRGHPEIFVSQPKEPFYFCTDLPGLRKVETEDAYLKIFDIDGGQPRATGEASAIYLYSQVACRRIFEFNSAARIIVMLRNPVDLLPSYHAQQLFSLNEDQHDFATAWQLQEARLNGESIPRVCKDPGVLHYRSIGMLGQQVERLLTIFPREQVLFCLFENFSASTPAVYQAVLRFLNVPDDGRECFPRMNQHKVNSFGALERARRAIARHPKLRRSLKESIERLGIERSLRKVMRKTTPRKPLDAELRETIRRTFADDVQRLSQLIQRDLTHWTTPARAAA